MDSYYLPWSTLFNVRHTNHICIVVGINDSQNSIRILDLIDKFEPVDMDMSILYKACTFYLEVICSNKKRIMDTKQIDKMIINKEIPLIDVDMIKNMNQFAVAFKKYFNPKIEFIDASNFELLLEEKLIDEFRRVMLCINMFQVWIEWREYKEKEERYKGIIQKLTVLLNKWNVFINIIYKHAMSGWKRPLNEVGYEWLKSFTDIINQISSEVMNILAYNLENKDFKIKYNYEDALKCSNSQLYTSKPLTIDKYYNNKGFKPEKDQCQDCDLTGCGEYFILNENFGTKSADKTTHCRLKGIDFKMRFDKIYDNILCKGQTLNITNLEELNNIKMNLKKTLGIAFLCCAEWGECKDLVTIVFDNGYEEDILIDVNDISNTESNTSVVGGKTVNGITGKIVQEKAALTVIKIFFDHGDISKIVLPNSANMHILSITLLRY